MRNGNVGMAYNLSGGLHSTVIMRNYPNYFAPDQLYDLENDPAEQTNLAADPSHARTLADMQERLRKYLSGFARPFDLALDGFLTTDAYERLTKATLADDHVYKTYWYTQHAY
jgi:hypothetical protein